MNLPKLKPNIKTYSSAFSKIDKESHILEIGSSSYYESLNDQQFNMLNTICEIQPHRDFNRNICALMSYRNEINQNKEIVKYNLYDNAAIDMDGVVSSIDIYIKNILNIPNYITNNQKVYTKQFITQSSSVTLTGYETFIDSGINTVSNAYGFGGGYTSHFLPNKIQPYFFYICNMYNEAPYISLMSATDFINQRRIQLAEKYDISTLEDDILNGKIVLNINNINYKSISSNKTGLTNNLIHITFAIV